ncbi:MAG: hypothetical protein ACQERJ_09115 [Bacillota bacterium]
MVTVSIKKDEGTPFLITMSYLVSFLTIRLMVLIAGSAESPFAQVAKEGLSPDAQFYIGRNIILFGHHIHHFYFGILLICWAGWITIVGSEYLTRRHAAIIYGAGLGLFMDESGLLLTWGDYYSDLTYLLSLFLSGVFLNIIFFPYFWREVRAELLDSNLHSWTWNTLLDHTSFIKVADIVSDKTNKTEKASLLFTGVIYLSVGALILLYPGFVYYWVAGVFFIQGVSSLIRSWKS